MIKIEVDPNDELDKAIKKASKDVDDLTIPLKFMTREWFKGNRSIFDLSRKSKGKYADLSTKPFLAFWQNKNGFASFYAGGYKEYKNVNVGFTYPILRSSGKLAESMTNPSDSDAINSIINKKSLLLGTNVSGEGGVPYPKWLNDGTKKMPARPFMLLGGEQVATKEVNQRKENWIKLLEDFVIQKSKGFAS